jgi:hypothetical protein
MISRINLKCKCGSIVAKPKLGSGAGEPPTRRDSQASRALAGTRSARPVASRRRSGAVRMPALRSSCAFRTSTDKLLTSRAYHRGNGALVGS